MITYTYYLKGVSPFLFSLKILYTKKIDYDTIDLILVLGRKIGIEMPLNIVLFEPEIPQNTGNIARTCAATGSNLHLIKPLGFSVQDKYLKRAGLDYWNLVNIKYYNSIEELISEAGDEKIFFSTTKESRFYTEVKYSNNCYIVFGKETAGLPDYIHKENKDKRIRIPMINNEHARSLNLANSVNIVMYEALRQLGFPNLV